MKDWSIWMLEYARRTAQPVGLVLYGYWNEGTISVPFSYVYLDNGDMSVLVDVGYDDNSHGGELARGDGVSNWHDAETVLSAIGRRPEDIAAVIITHAHFDHIGNLSSFPNAQVFLQSREIDEWERILASGHKFSRLAGALDPTDLLHLATIDRRGMLTRLDGAADNILPGISVRTAFDTHTAGSQYVIISTDRGDWVVTGDNVYSYRNVEGDDDGCYIPIGYSAGSQTNNLFSMRDMLSTAGGAGRLIIVHEGETFRRFSSSVSPSGMRVAEMHLAPGAASRLPASSGTTIG